MALGEGVGRHDRGLADRQSRQVLLVDVDQDLGPRRRREGHQHRPGRDDVAALDVAGDQHAVGRRTDHRIGQLGLRRREGGLVRGEFCLSYLAVSTVGGIGLDLDFSGLVLSPRGLQVARGGVEGGARDGVLLDQALQPVIGHLGVSQRRRGLRAVRPCGWQGDGLYLHELGPRLSDLCGGLLHGGLEVGGLQYDQGLAFADGLPFLDRDLVDYAGQLAADIGAVGRQDPAAGDHRGGEVAPRDAIGGDGRPEQQRLGEIGGPGDRDDAEAPRAIAAQDLRLGLCRRRGLQGGDGCGAHDAPQESGNCSTTRFWPCAGTENLALRIFAALSISWA